MRSSITTKHSRNVCHWWHSKGFCQTSSCKYQLRLEEQEPRCDCSASGVPKWERTSSHQSRWRFQTTLPGIESKICKPKEAIASQKTQDVPADQKASFSLYCGWRPPIWIPNVKLLIYYLRQISAFKWSLVRYSSLCKTQFIISPTCNITSGTHGITLQGEWREV